MEKEIEITKDLTKDQLISELEQFRVRVNFVCDIFWSDEKHHRINFQYDSLKNYEESIIKKNPDLYITKIVHIIETQQKITREEMIIILRENHQEYFTFEITWSGGYCTRHQFLTKQDFYSYESDYKNCNPGEEIVRIILCKQPFA